jgi:hypothetical protein
MEYVPWNETKYVDFNSLLGLTLTEVTGGVGDDSMTFTTSDGRVFFLFHSQNCCESVSVEDITGDLADLIGSPILIAEEATSSENPPGVEMGYQESFTWTFYKLATIKGYVDIRWYGSSNGYYGESVEFIERVPEQHEEP